MTHVFAAAVRNIRTVVEKCLKIENLWRGIAGFWTFPKMILQAERVGEPALFF